MARFKPLIAAAVLSTLTAGQVLAQAAIQEPGLFAFYHPDADVLNPGRPTPLAGGGALSSAPFGGSNAQASMATAAKGSACPPLDRSLYPSSGTNHGHDGHRHWCR